MSVAFPAPTVHPVRPAELPLFGWTRLAALATGSAVAEVWLEDGGSRVVVFAVPDAADDAMWRSAERMVDMYHLHAYGRPTAGELFELLQSIVEAQLAAALHALLSSEG